MAKGAGNVLTSHTGAKTIVIAAPKGSTGSLQTPTKLITTVPKLGGGGNTQFIVVSPQGSIAGTQGTTTINPSIVGGRVLGEL